MNGPIRRLLDDSEHRSVEPVLRTGLADDPSAESIARAARALGLGSGAALALARAKSAAHGASEQAGAAGAAKGGIAVATKWLAAGLLVGGLTAASLVFLPREQAPSRPQLASPPAERQVVVAPPSVVVAPPSVVVAPPSVVSAPPSAVPAAPPAVHRELRAPAGLLAPDSTLSVPSRRTKQGLVDSTTAVATPSVGEQKLDGLESSPPAVEGSGERAGPSELAREIALLDEARRHLGSGNPDAALGALRRRQVENLQTGARSRSHTLARPGARREWRAFRGSAARETVARRGARRRLWLPYGPARGTQGPAVLGSLAAVSVDASCGAYRRT